MLEAIDIAKITKCAALHEGYSSNHFQRRTTKRPKVHYFLHESEECAYVVAALSKSSTPFAPI